MNKFKIGDKVEITGELDSYSINRGNLTAGLVGTVDESDSDRPYVEFGEGYGNSGQWALNESLLTLVKETRNKFKVGDEVIVVRVDEGDSYRLGDIVIVNEDSHTPWLKELYNDHREAADEDQLRLTTDQFTYDELIEGVKYQIVGKEHIGVYKMEDGVLVVNYTNLMKYPEYADGTKFTASRRMNKEHDMYTLYREPVVVETVESDDPFDLEESCTPPVAPNLKDMLVGGTVVRVRRGNYGVVVGDRILLNDDTNMPFGGIEPDLKWQGWADCDIMAVYDSSGINCLSKIGNGNLTVSEVWTRVEEPETPAPTEKELKIESISDEQAAMMVEYERIGAELDEISDELYDLLVQRYELDSIGNGCGFYVKRDGETVNIYIGDTFTFAEFDAAKWYHDGDSLEGINKYFSSTKFKLAE